jgi:hypothetical protein
MIAETSEPQTAYPVEVSGWDEHEDFFVEKTELHWSEIRKAHPALAPDCFRRAGFSSPDRSPVHRSGASSSVSGRALLGMTMMRE